jgi:hypothetical protein
LAILKRIKNAKEMELDAPDILFRKQLKYEQTFLLIFLFFLEKDQLLNYVKRLQMNTTDFFSFIRETIGLSTL